jgi:hypothetical protein
MNVSTHGCPSGEDERLGKKTDQAGWETIPRVGSLSEHRGIRLPHQGSWPRTQSVEVDWRREVNLKLLRFMFTEIMWSQSLLVMSEIDGGVSLMLIGRIGRQTLRE